MIRAAKQRAAARAEQHQALEESLLAATDRPALASGSNHREITLEMIEQAPSYEARANLVRAFVRQDSARAALVVRHLMQAGARAGRRRTGQRARDARDRKSGSASWRENEGTN